MIEWFCQIGLKQYIDKIAEYDVDGLLLMRLGEEELEEIGITSKIQIRKFQVSYYGHEGGNMTVDVDSLRLKLLSNIPLSNRLM